VPQAWQKRAPIKYSVAQRWHASLETGTAGRPACEGEGGCQNS
jgi:hypothetical protein